LPYARSDAVIHCQPVTALILLRGSDTVIDTSYKLPTFGGKTSPWGWC